MLRSIPELVYVDVCMTDWLTKASPVPSVGGLVSGIRNRITSVPSKAVAAIHQNAPLEPSLSATSPDRVVLIEAPRPEAAPTMPLHQVETSGAACRDKAVNGLRVPASGPPAG